MDSARPLTYKLTTIAEEGAILEIFEDYSQTLLGRPKLRTQLTETEGRSRRG